MPSHKQKLTWQEEKKHILDEYKHIQQVVNNRGRPARDLEEPIHDLLFGKEFESTFGEAKPHVSVLNRKQCDQIWDEITGKHTGHPHFREEISHAFGGGQAKPKFQKMSEREAKQWIFDHFNSEFQHMLKTRKMTLMEESRATWAKGMMKAAGGLIILGFAAYLSTLDFAVTKFAMFTAAMGSVCLVVAGLIIVVLGITGILRSIVLREAVNDTIGPEAEELARAIGRIAPLGRSGRH